MAIDRLADRGIIGVYSVRPEPKPPKNAVRLDGEPAPEEEKPAPRLEAPAPVKTESGSEVVFAQLVDKLGSLLVQVEKLLSRPPQQQVIYQSSGPARDRGDHARPRKSNVNLESSSTLRDIFQTNLDLRQSLEKLANNTGTASRLAEAAGRVGDAATRLTEAAVESSAGEPKMVESKIGEPQIGESKPADPDLGRPVDEPTRGSHEARKEPPVPSVREPSVREPSVREPSLGRELVDAHPAA
jgi:hypothetical protein